MTTRKRTKGGDIITQSNSLKQCMDVPSNDAYQANTVNSHQFTLQLVFKRYGGLMSLGINLIIITICISYWCWEIVPDEVAVD